MEINPVINPFKHMFKMQEKLLTAIQPIEGLPAWPIDLNTKSGQKVIKDFIRRLVEELSEAYVELTLCNDSMAHNNHQLGKKHCIQYNLEMADAHHFLFNILIYSGIDNSMLDSYIFHFLDEQMGMVSLYDADNSWSNILKLGKFYNQQVDMGPSISKFNIFSLHELSENPEWSGGSKTSPPALLTHAQLLWEITCQLNMAANELKNRDHHQTTKEVNFFNYKERLLYAIISLGRYLDFAGFTQTGIYRMYYKKNKQNHERINAGY